jgi:hypothetical protein
MYKSKMLGENLARTSEGNRVAEQACKMWYDESSIYKFDFDEFSQPLAGHFTQVKKSQQ